jgi:hypothetical protein
MSRRRCSVRKLPKLSRLLSALQQVKTTKPSSVKARGLKASPTWEINGELDSGVKKLPDLARLSGYKGPNDF